MSTSGTLMKPIPRRIGRPSRRAVERAAVEQEAGIDRREAIINAAAAQFTEHGFDRTSTRDIGTAAGILSGSLCYYFNFREEIFVDVHRAGMRRRRRRALLENAGFMIMVFRRFPVGMGDMQTGPAGQRNGYEKILADVIAQLNLPDDPDRNL
ncbi:MAG: helix-turn-helix domain-containing protein [Paracoccus sp. (in: a-proteobacteria)]|uniref:helix-turn-helix domain-containing protein n=1 Tax=Paracoccus sp. TaxID=267 RepID=UPI0039E59E9A